MLTGQYSGMVTGYEYFSPDLTVHVMSDNERQRVEWAFLPSVRQSVQFLPSFLRCLLPFLGIAGVHYLPFPPSLGLSLRFYSSPGAEQSGVDK